MVTGARWRALLATACLVAFTGLARAQGGSEVDALFQQAVDAYRQGNDQEALKKLQEVIAKDPSREDALRLRDVAGWKFWADMMVKKGEHEVVAKHLLGLAQGGERAHMADAEKIRKLVGDLKSEDFTTRAEATRTILADHGDYAVPHMLDILGQAGDEDHRVAVIDCLTRMRSDAVLPLIEVLWSDNDMLRQTAAAILGNIGDPRAAGELKLLADKASDPGSAAAQRALMKMFPNGAPPAVDLLRDKAHAYYRQSPDVLKEVGGARAVWRWEEGTLKGYELPRPLYACAVAEGALHRAVGAAPDRADVRGLLARVLFAQKAEIDALVASAGDKAEDLKGLAAGLARGAAGGMGIGVDALESALTEARRDGDGPSAVAVINALAAQLNPSELKPGALTEALDDGHREGRYAAAIALGHLARQGGWPGSERLVDILAAAAGEGAVRHVLVIDDQDATRNQILGELREAGMFVSGARRGEDGLLMAKRAPVPDLVILRTDLGAGQAETSLSSMKVVHDLKRDYRTMNVPVIGLTAESRAAADKDLFKDLLGNVITTPLAKDAYVGAVKSGLPEVDSGRALALDYAARAAASLGALARQGQGFGLTGAVPALAEAARSGRPDSVRLPAIEALAEIGGSNAQAAQGAIEALTGACAPSNPPAIRAAAAMALGRVCRSAGATPDAALQALMEGAKDADHSVASACGTGLGACPLNPAQRGDALTKLRVSLAELTSAPAPAGEGEKKPEGEGGGEMNKEGGGGQ